MDPIDSSASRDFKHVIRNTKPLQRKNSIRLVEGKHDFVIGDCTDD